MEAGLCLIIVGGQEMIAPPSFFPYLSLVSSLAAYSSFSLLL